MLSKVLIKSKNFGKTNPQNCCDDQQHKTVLRNKLLLWERCFEKTLNGQITWNLLYCWGFSCLQKCLSVMSPIFGSYDDEMQFIWSINCWEADLTFYHTFLTYYLHFGISSNWFVISLLRNLNFHQKFTIFTFYKPLSPLNWKTESNYRFLKKSVQTLATLSHHILQKHFEITAVLFFIKWPKCIVKMETFSKGIPYTLGLDFICFC